MRCALPGGSWQDGRLERTVVLRPLTGRLEQDMLGQFVEGRSWPEIVSGLLDAAVDRVGDRPSSVSLVEELAVTDRQYLLLRLGALMHGDHFWATATCSQCRAPFDLGLRRSQLPVKAAEPGFPFFALDCSGHRLVVRAPSGADQTHVAWLPEDQTVRALLQRCLVSVDGQTAPPDFAARLDADTVARIEGVLDERAPAIGTRVATRCPECTAELVVEVDPYLPARWRRGDLYGEVHVIAGRYHWSEADILALPRQRRQLYLELIGQESDLHR